jgi:hypothetical protein
MKIPPLLVVPKKFHLVIPWQALPNTMLLDENRPVMKEKKEFQGPTITKLSKQPRLPKRRTSFFIDAAY